jgi:hypothetical protein
VGRRTNEQVEVPMTPRARAQSRRAKTTGRHDDLPPGGLAPDTRGGVAPHIISPNLRRRKVEVPGRTPWAMSSPRSRMKSWDYQTKNVQGPAPQ